jgi:hypothetical protein
VKDLRKLRNTIKSRETVTLHEPVPHLAATFPERDVCDVLIAAYTRTFEGIYRILHAPTFRKEYDAFWYPRRTASTAFRMKLALVLAIGAAFYPPKESSQHQRLQRLAGVWIQAAQWWLTGPSDASVINLDEVQVACLLQLARQISTLGTTFWLSGDIALRLAMAAGLHHDPERFPTLSPFQRQMRRRLWFTAVELTLASSLDAPGPFSVPEYDTKPPLNLDDADFSPSMDRLPDPKPAGKVSDQSLQLLLLESLPTRRQAASICNNMSHDFSHDTAIQLSDELRRVCRNVATFISRAEDTPFMVVLRPWKFHAQFLDISLRRYILLLHRPFLIQARKDPRFHYSRSMCLETAMILGSYATAVKLPSPAEDDLSRFMIVVKGPLNVPFSLDIITILGLEVMTQFEEQAGLCATSDPATILAKERRAPVFRILEHVKDQLHQFIRLGSPSMKRCGYITAMLTQLQALEAGESVPDAVTAAIKEAATSLKPLLEATIANAPPKDTVETLTGLQKPPSVAEEFTPASFGGMDEMDFAFLGPDQFFGFPNMFPFANLGTFGGGAGDGGMDL